MITAEQARARIDLGNKVLTEVDERINKASSEGEENIQVEIYHPFTKSVVAILHENGFKVTVGQNNSNDLLIEW